MSRRFSVFLGSFWLLLGCFWAPLGLGASGAPLGRLLGRLLVRSWGLLGSLMAQQSPRSPLLGLFGGAGGRKNVEKTLCFRMILTICPFHYRIRFGGVRESSGGAPDEARSLQEALQEGQEAPDGTQEGPKRAPRGPQEGLQRGPQRVPKRDSDPTWLGDPSGTPPGPLRDASGTPPGCNFGTNLGSQTSPQ